MSTWVSLVLLHEKWQFFIRCERRDAASFIHAVFYYYLADFCDF